ncbi:ParB/RepB/Spo0J family partition protein (plasmid) [Streptomyces seoulensis]|uniref:ParB/RepB/Spo0J family partition protein n=1 Tax=Streptomyces seoulensis TaxID=73044 RepID=A0A4P6U500_STRSO|nr:ParB/RepB/Spo0J family partition protein [Streptomyces seoulensis]QBJ94493.1 ParB/RepB/Spo0J family partition protein [Streptomyces seoulensis]
MSGKRISLASLATSKVETVPGASRPDLLHVHPNTVAPTPLNPRRNFDETELTELGEDMRAGQLQPCVAVPKASYLKLYPEHADELPDTCRYVMAAGERRWRAAVNVGLESLDLLIRHDLTESRIRFLAAVLSENVQRANFNPIEEANGLHAMLTLHDGNQSAAAKAMGKSKQWFNQRIGLLRLTDEMVQLVLDGQLTAFREMRRYAAMPPEEQYATWKLDQEQPRPTKQQRPGVAETPAAYTAVYTVPETPPVEPAVASRPEVEAPAQVEVPAQQEADAYTAVYPPAEAAPAPKPAVPAHPNPSDGGPELGKTRTAESIPEPRDTTAAEAENQAPRFPYEHGGEALFLLLRKMAAEDRATVFLGLGRDEETQAAVKARQA